MRKTILTGLLSLATAAVPAAVFAGDAATYINPYVGYTVFDNQTGLEDEAGVAGISIESKLDGAWYWEIDFQGADPKTEAKPSPDLDLKRYSLGLNKYFDIGSSHTTPFLGASLGHSFLEQSGQSDIDETEARLKAGLRYAVDERWSVRGDIGYIYGTDSESNHGVATLALSYALGAKAPAEPAPAPAPAAPAPAAPQADADSDRDGVADSADRCPGTPLRIAVDSSGCPADADGDGVPNYRDRCPNSPAGQNVDYRGCGKVAKQVDQVKLVVNFAFDSAVVSRSYADEIQKVAAFLKANPEVNATIEGHTDGTGPADYNQDLSQRRASAVKDILVKQYGIASSRLRASGYGENRPVASNQTEAGRAANRRASAVIRVDVK